MYRSRSLLVHSSHMIAACVSYTGGHTETQRSHEHSCRPQQPISFEAISSWVFRSVLLISAPTPCACNSIVITAALSVCPPCAATSATISSASSSISGSTTTPGPFPGCDGASAIIPAALSIMLTVTSAAIVSVVLLFMFLYPPIVVR